MQDNSRGNWKGPSLNHRPFNIRGAKVRNGGKGNIGLYESTHSSAAFAIFTIVTNNRVAWEGYCAFSDSRFNQVSVIAITSALFC